MYIDIQWCTYNEILLPFFCVLPVHVLFLGLYSLIKDATRLHNCTIVHKYVGRKNVVKSCKYLHRYKYIDLLCMQYFYSLFCVLPVSMYIIHTYVRKYVIFLVFIRQDSRTQLDKENVSSVAQLRKSKKYNIFLFCDKL